MHCNDNDSSFSCFYFLVSEEFVKTKFCHKTMHNVDFLLIDKLHGAIWWAHSRLWYLLTCLNFLTNAGNWTCEPAGFAFHITDHCKKLMWMKQTIICNVLALTGHIVLIRYEYWIQEFRYEQHKWDEMSSTI